MKFVSRMWPWLHFTHFTGHTRPHSNHTRMCLGVEQYGQVVECGSLHTVAHSTLDWQVGVMNWLKQDRLLFKFKKWWTEVVKRACHVRNCPSALSPLKQKCTHTVSTSRPITDDFGRILISSLERKSAVRTTPYVSYAIWRRRLNALLSMLSYTCCCSCTSVFATARRRSRAHDNSRSRAKSKTVVHRCASTGVCENRFWRIKTQHNDKTRINNYHQTDRRGRVLMILKQQLFVCTMNIVVVGAHFYAKQSV